MNMVGIAVEGGIGLIVTAMNTHKDSPFVQRTGCGALWNLSVNGNPSELSSVNSHDVMQRRIVLSLLRKGALQLSSNLCRLTHQVREYKRMLVVLFGIWLLMVIALFNQLVNF
jgi:hypothetical protein